MWKGVCHREHRMFSELQVAQCGLSTGYMRTSDGQWSRKITRATFAVLRDLNFGLWDMGYTAEFQAGDWCDQNCPLEKLITLECWRPVVGEWEWTRKLVRKLLVRNQLGRNKLRINKWFTSQKNWVIQQGLFLVVKEGIQFSRGMKFYSQPCLLSGSCYIKALWICTTLTSLDMQR